MAAETLNGWVLDETANEILFLSIDYARSAIAVWADDGTHFLLHSPR